jgi:hypothetical protein
MLGAHTKKLPALTYNRCGAINPRLPGAWILEAFLKHILTIIFLFISRLLICCPIWPETVLDCNH